MAKKTITIRVTAAVARYLDDSKLSVSATADRAIRVWMEAEREGIRRVRAQFSRGELGAILGMGPLGIDPEHADAMHDRIIDAKLDSMGAKLTNFHLPEWVVLLTWHEQYWSMPEDSRNLQKHIDILM